MTPAVQLARIERALRDIAAALAKAPPSPRTREHRARLSTFERACMNLAGRDPRPEQTSALLEGVLELHARVFEGGPAPRVPSIPSMPSIPSVPSISSIPVTNAMRAAMTAHARVTVPAPPASQRPTVKPPPGGARPPSDFAVTAPPPPPSTRRP